jgi:hypothetical protein
MTTAEMNRRLDTMSEQQIANILDLIRQGYGASGIAAERHGTIKQINAVFEYHYNSNGYGKRLP